MFRFKNQGRREYADFLAWEMYRRTKEWLMTVRPDALVPVPVHKKRMKKRGYNQAAVLAERLFRSAAARWRTSAGSTPFGLPLLCASF